MRVKRRTEKQFLKVETGTKYQVNVYHDLNTMLDFDGVPCENDKDYILDECVLKQLDDISMKKLGCVTPFGIRKENICTESDKAIEAYDLFNHYTENYQTMKTADMKDNGCLEPCSFLGVKFSKTNEAKSEELQELPELEGGVGLLVLNFNEYIQEMTSYYSYEMLSFIAEIGGYVGLFLGASVYQVADIYECARCLDIKVYLLRPHCKCT